MSLKITGKLPSGKHLEKLKRSPNYNGAGFQNLSDTPMKPQDVSYWKMITEFIKKDKNTIPPTKLPFVKTDMAEVNSSSPAIVWFGHSSYFLQVDGKKILVDPVLSGAASPIPSPRNSLLYDGRPVQKSAVRTKFNVLLNLTSNL